MTFDQQVAADPLPILEHVVAPRLFNSRARHDTGRIGVSIDGGARKIKQVRQRDRLAVRPAMQIGPEIRDHIRNKTPAA